MKFTSRESAAAANGHTLLPYIAVDGFATDTRALVAGPLFVPLVAEREGRDFIDEALGAGALAYVTQSSRS